MVTSPRRQLRHRGRFNSRHAFARRLLLEPLEDRRLLTSDISDPLVNIVGQTGGNPPDTVMDVGSNHIIQMINSTPVQIWDKHGNSLQTITNFGDLWNNNTLVLPDPGNQCRSPNNFGDPVVVYDHLADRWLLSQFHSDFDTATPPNTIAPFGMCIAVSRTADPVGGVNGTTNDGDEWWLYRFDTPNFPDYPKFGVWPDAYYMSSNEGVEGFYAFDRVKMLNGDSTAESVRAQTGSSGSHFLPADLDGPAPPPGTPDFFVRTNNSNRLEVWTAVPDFTANTLTITQIENLPVTPFTVMACDRAGDGGPDASFDCIPQPDEVDTLDAISSFSVMMQLKYRNFGGYQSMVVNQAVDVQNVIQAETGYNPAREVAGIRWYEVRTTDGGANWSIQQQDDYAPQPVASQPGGITSDAQLVHRWMGSTAIDKDGNIALGYSITNSNSTNGQELYPSIRYAGRLAGDAPNTLPQGEKEIFRGTGPSGNGDATQDGGRWGDYSALSVDPVDDCTFWYTNHVAGSVTRIASFRFSTCPGPDEFEANDTRADATILGSLPKITLNDASIDDESDIDYYMYTAQDTGKLIINAFTAFEQNTVTPGPDNSLVLRVVDASGDVIATGGALSVVTPGLGVTGVVIPVVSQQRYFIQVSASTDQFFEYDLEIENFQIRTPLVVDLQAGSDSGRNDNDDVTNDTTPTFDIILDDDDLTSAGFVRDDDFDVQVFNNGLLLGQAAYVSGRLWVFSGNPHDLQEGHNNFITAAVLIRDRANPEATGRGEFSPALKITLDTTAPSGTAHLFPDQDTGIWGFDATMHDGITGHMTPLLYGAAEANALVRASIDGAAAGTAVAIPLDGDEAFPPPPEFDGNYFLQTILNLGDGEHTIEVFFQDLAGNESPADEDATLVIFVDTAGPKINNVTRGDVSTNNVHSFDGVTSVFEPKPSDNGPDPLVHSIVIHFSDLPDRTADFADYHALFLALAEEEGNYYVKGDHNGYIAIVDVNVTFETIPDDGLPEIARVELVFDRPLPDDRYTVWVSDNLSDAAGNPLDGESGAVGPFEGNDVPSETPPIFPTGDGEHGGDFWARFTIDSRPEIGVFALGTTYLDINGNSVWEPEGQDNDYTNRDIAFVFGFRDDRVFAGNFAPAGAASASGFDKLGAFGNAGAGSAWRWRLDFNHDGVVDYDVASGVNNSADPVAGNFSAAHPGDEIGLFNAGKWWLDSGGDNNVGGAVDTFLQGNMRGQPVVGDFDGDGLDDLGAWDGGNAGTQFDGFFQFDFASNGLTGNTDATIQFDLPGTFQKAIAADMNEDGIDDVGLFVSRREAVPPNEAAEWFFLVSNVALKSTGTVNALNHPFTPVPFGNDLFAQFGDEAALPVVGNFDPPTSPVGGTGDHNPLLGLDVNNDGKITAIDALLVVNHLNLHGGGTAAPSGTPLAPFMDVNNDLRISPHDAVLVINHLNAQVSATFSNTAEGEGDSAVSSDSHADDNLLALLANDLESLRKRKR
jgi:hypothetical protein